MTDEILSQENGQVFWALMTATVASVLWTPPLASNWEFVHSRCRRDQPWQGQLSGVGCFMWVPNSGSEPHCSSLGLQSCITSELTPTFSILRKLSKASDPSVWQYNNVKDVNLILEGVVFRAKALTDSRFIYTVLLHRNAAAAAAVRHSWSATWLKLRNR